MKILLLAVAVIFSATITTVCAQSKDIKKYREQSGEMRKSVWAWDKPQFKVRDIPAKYATVSKVVLAQHTELTADSKSRFVYYGLSFGTKKEQTLTEIVRELVKVNDKNAVAEYSELSFTQFEKSSGFYSSDKTTSFVGVRVIKPNGTVEEIDADDIVLTKDESKQKRAKIAIPDLQPGDILDYFLATQQFLTNDLSNKPYHVILFSDAPVLSLSFHAQLGKKYAIQYRSYNGAPDLQVSKNDDKDIIVDVVKNNIPASETALWVAAAQQLPFIRMNISLGYRGLGSRYMDTQKPGEVSKNTESGEFLDDKANSLSVDYYNGYWMKSGKASYDLVEDETRRRAKRCNINYKALSDEDKAELLFYNFRYIKFLGFNINKLQEKIDIGDYNFNGQAFPVFCSFKAAGLDPAILVSNSRTGFRMNEIMNQEDLTTTAYITGINKFFSIQSIYDTPFMVPEDIEGLTKTKSFTFEHPGMIMSPKKMVSLTKVEDGPEVPLSSSGKNAHIENLKLSLSADKSSLLVHRSTVLEGLNKASTQRQLILYEDYYEEERKAFNEEKPLIQSLEDDKKGRKYVDEVKSAFAEARKKQKDAFIEEAKYWFDQDVTDLKDYKTDTLGVRHSAPDFVYSSSFNLNGMVKKAGNNIILEIGKIEGEPLVIKPEQLKRDLDVYMPYARCIEYNVEFEIPDGYSVEGIAALNKDVTNDAGFFTVRATATDKLVTIQVKKHYLHNFEPAGNWNKIILFTSAASDWANTKLLLRKK